MTAISEALSDERLADLIRAHREKGKSGTYPGSGGMHPDWSDMTVTALLELQSLRSGNGGEVRVKPDHCYDPDDWEYSMPWADRNELVEQWDVNKVHRVSTLIDGPDKWVVICWDEENGPETRWFDTEAEAKAAIPALDIKP